MTQPTVTVVMPAYNAANFIGAAISGVLNQTYPDVRLVVVDDGSEDDTAALAEAYGKRVTVVQQANAGPSAARTAGIAASDSELICFCDSDDVLLPRHLQLATRALAEGGSRSWVSNASWLLTENGIVARKRDFAFGTPPPDQQVDAILDANFVPIHSTVPRALLEETGGFDSSMVWCEDWDLWLRAILRGWRVSYVRERTALYRVTAGSLSKHSDGMVEGHRTMLTKALDEESDLLTAEQQATLRERLAAPSIVELSKTLSAAVAARDVRTAKAVYAQMARLNPLDPHVRRRAALLRLYPTSDRLWARPVTGAVDRALALRDRGPAAPKGG